MEKEIRSCCVSGLMHETRTLKVRGKKKDMPAEDDGFQRLE